MQQLSPIRRNLALFALALGGFAIGVTEFATMGVLPEIARDLLPGFDASPDTVIARAGMLITVYALGVVVGAPLFSVFGARMSQTRLAFWLLALFIIGTALSACMPNFGTLAAFRFIAGLPHGAYFGVSALLAARLMGPGSQGKGVALSLTGLTLANVVGVPLATWLGQAFGWRAVYLLVAFLFAVTMLLVVLFLPRFPGNPSRSPRSEISALLNPRIWVLIGVGAVGFGGFFAVYSYIAEVTTRETGLPAGAVPWVLSTLGIGMTIGNVFGGWASDRNLNRTALLGFVAFILSMLAYTQLAGSAVGLIIGVLLVGFTSSVLLPAVQARLIRISNEAALFGAAINHAAFNIGNGLGAWLGGLAIAGGLGYLAPGWVGAALAALGALLLVASIAIERRDKARNLNTIGLPTISVDPKE